MDAIRVGRDERSGGLEGVPEAYRPIPHGKRRDGHCTNPFSERLRRERGRREALNRQRGLTPRLRVCQAAANASPRRASMAASTIGASPAPRASASSVLTPTIGSPRACASARAVAIPIRRPVKLPGPTPTASRSSASQPTPAASSASSAAASSRPACAGRTPGAGSSRTSKTASSTRTPATVEGVAVSSPSTITTTAPAGRRPRARAPRAAPPAARPAAPRARAARATRRT